MRRFAFWILGIFPYLEMYIRRLYYNSNFLLKLKKTKKIKAHQLPSVSLGLYEKVVEHIKELGIKKGDILIVHSSMDGLAATGASAKQYIDMLLELVGDEGTLVLPAFPLFKTEKDQGVLKYDPKRTVCSTGMMPNIFIRYPGVIRSVFPINTLAAKGKHAEKMMCDNLQGDLAHGKHSSWEYCVEHNAKILFIGLKAYNRNTVVHAAEELLDSEWPIKDWFEKKQYLVKRTHGEELITIRQRKQFWSRYLTLHYRYKIFVKERLLNETNIDGLCIGYIPDSKQVVDFLMSHARQGELMYHIPQKYWK